MSFEKIYKQQLEEVQKTVTLLRNLIDQIEESGNEETLELITTFKEQEKEKMGYIPFNQRNMKVEYFVSNAFGRNDICIKIKDSESSGVPHFLDFESKKDAELIASFLNSGLIKMTGSYLTSDDGPIEL